MKAFRTEVLEPLLRKYHGRIFNTGGDSFLLEFNSAVSAIECWTEALGLLKGRQAGFPADQRFRFRAGIHLGEVLVQDGDLLGETVNMASRLQTVARPDSLCASASVVDQVARRIECLTFRDIGLQTVKNMPEPVQAYLAVFSPEQTGNPATKEEVPKGDPRVRTPSSGARDLPSAVPASGKASELLMALARSCPDGLGRKDYSLEDIQELMPRLSAAEIEDLVHEVEADGLAKLTKFFGGIWHLHLTPQFYAEVDGSVMGWSATEDARTLAEQMLASDTGRAAALHQASGWDRRRFNPAFRYLLDHVSPNFVSRERSPDYPAAGILMQPEVRAALRRFRARG